MSHRCHALGCTRAVPPRLLMCPGHWRQVPGHLQRLIGLYYRPGQERDKRPSPHYIFAQRCVVLLHALQRGLRTADELEIELSRVADRVGEPIAREVMDTALRLWEQDRARRLNGSTAARPAAQGGEGGRHTEEGGT